ncbi:MAG: Ger(x)C family spore germination protein [Clostridiales bacterium]|nr:Ger(x)C family spore germination protein [Clostridiales bacterium]
MKKTFRNSLSILLAACILLTLPGCWDSLDIETRDIMTALIVDKKGGECYFYTEVANLSGKKSQQNGDQSKDNFSILTSEGKTFSEARDDYNRKTVNQVFLGASRILIFTNRMADDGIEEYLNRLRGQLDYRKTIPLSTTFDEPMDILNDVPENSASVGFAIEKNLESIVKEGTWFSMNVGDALQVLASKKAGFLVPDLAVSNKAITISGMTVFDQNGKRIGKISAENRNGIVYFFNPHAIFFYDIRQGDKKYTVRIIFKKKKIVPAYTGGQLTLQIDMSFNANLNFADKLGPVTQETQTKIQNQLESRIKQEIEQTVKTSQQKYRCDYLGFYKYFRASYQKEFEKMNWQDVYSHAQITAAAHVNINESNIPVES